MQSFFPAPEEFGRHIIFGSTHVTTLAGEHLQLSLADIPADGVVDWHSHVNEQMGMVISGTAVFHIGDQTRTLHAGDMFRIPGNVRHKVEAVGGPVRALDAFYPIRDEYR
jgi:quercetin dioxygenase-like cupin family protein